MPMIALGADAASLPRRVLCIGAHADDIEIGCAGTVLTLAHRQPALRVDWVVLSAEGARADEARRGAARVLAGVPDASVHVERFPQRYFPAAYGDLKRYFDALGERAQPDVVLCPRLEDMHQDHRTVAELVWQTFRSQLVLEYEIVKYEGDLGRPNAYVALTDDVAEHKLAVLDEVFVTQRARDWFDRDTFRGLLRLRGVECRAPSGLAEAFHARKVRLW